MKTPVDLLRAKAKKYCKAKYGNATKLAKTAGWTCAAMSQFINKKMSIEYGKAVKIEKTDVI